MAAAKSKRPGTALAKWDEELAARAKAQRKAESAVAIGQFISLKSGVMTYGGAVVPDNKLDAVIISSILENIYYEGKFDPDVIQSPTCYAFGLDDETMKPHEKVFEAGNNQSDICANCEHNEFGSAETGRGKACGNVRRLCLIPADALDRGAEGVAEEPSAFLKVPVTSVKGWAKFVNDLEALNRPTLAYVAEISLVTDARTQFKLVFKAKEEITDPRLLEALLRRADAEDKTIGFPYAPLTDEPKKLPKKGGVKGKGVSRPSRPAAAAPARPAVRPAVRPAAKPVEPAARPAKRAGTPAPARKYA